MSSQETLRGNATLAVADGLFPYRDESFYSTTVGDRQIVLDIEDVLTFDSRSAIPSAFSGPGELRVYAENIVIGTTLSAGSLFIATHTITSAVGEGPGLSVDGDSTPNPDGPEGRNAGSVTLIAESIQGSSLGIPISAVGESGQPGTNGHDDTPGGGNGGNGGRGGTVTVLACHELAACLDAVRAVSRTTTGADAEAAFSSLSLLVGGVSVAGQQMDVGGQTLTDAVKALEAAMASDWSADVQSTVQTWCERVSFAVC